MIKKITKKEYDRIRWLMAHKMNQGRTCMIYKEKYYETTGASLAQIARWQKEIRDSLNKQQTLL